MEEFALQFQLQFAPPAMLSTRTVHSQCKDQTARELTVHPPSYGEAKKMKSPTLQSQDHLSG